MKLDTPHARLRFARAKAGDKTASDAARRINTKIVTYTAHENGTREFDRLAAIKYAEHFNVDPAWLMFGTPDGAYKVTSIGAESEVTALVKGKADGDVFYFQTEGGGSQEFALIPRLDVQASAGNGLVPYGEDPLEYLAFQSHWLRAKGVNPSAARILSARGDSMEETIRDGDVLLVDTSINRVKDNAIYVVIYGDMVLVKRIHGRMNGSLQLISDNPKYPAEEVTSGEVDLLNIAGRVMWFGRSI
jgi:phage repressor protein C with HTH and peptisase S24 domain